MSLPISVPNNNTSTNVECLMSEPVLPDLTPDQKDQVEKLLFYPISDDWKSKMIKIEKELIQKALQRNYNVWGNEVAIGLDDEKLFKIFNSVQTLNSSWHEHISAHITGQLLPLAPDKMRATSTIGRVLGQTKDFTRIRVSNLFKAYKLIADNTLEGITMTGGMSEDRPLYLIKTPKDPASDQIAHEVLVGLALNTIRDKVPNFMYTYGYTSCSPPVVVGKDVSELCARDSDSSVAMFEYVQNSVSIREFIQTSTYQELGVVMEQIVYALKYANHTLGFVHGDLHAGNILVRKFDQEIPVQTLSGEQRSKFLPVMIDYGFSTVRLDGIDFRSVNDSTSHFIGLKYLEPKAAPVDVYRIIVVLHNYILEGPKSHIDAADKLKVLSELYHKLGYGDIKKSTTPDVYGPVVIYKMMEQKPDQVLTPPNLWYRVLTTCDFSNGVKDDNPMIASLIELWYLFYGTSLTNVARSEVYRMIRNCDVYNFSYLLDIDISGLNERLSNVVPISANTGKEKILSFASITKLWRDVHTLNTVVYALHEYKPFSEQDLKRMNDLMKSADMLLESTQTLQERLKDYVFRDERHPTIPQLSKKYVASLLSY